MSTDGRQEKDGGQTIRIDIVSDVVCPWCIVGYKQLDLAQERTGVSVEVHWHPFELNPDMGDAGENLREHIAAKYGTTPEQSEQARERLTALGVELGFAFNYSDDMRMVNTFRAHQLLHWAASQSDGTAGAGHQGATHEMKIALFTAFFTRREDLNDAGVLAAVAAEIGLDRDEALAVLADERFAHPVRQAQHMWVARGVQGVPAMVFQQRYLVVGAQGIDNYAAVLEKLVQDAAA